MRAKHQTHLASSDDGAALVSTSYVLVFLPAPILFQSLHASVRIALINALTAFVIPGKHLLLAAVLRKT